MSKADAIRDFVYQHIIAPARRNGEMQVTFTVGEIAKLAGLRGNTYAISTALSAMSLHPYAGVKQVIEQGNRQSHAYTFIMDI
jgi:hypothetical protein